MKGLFIPGITAKMFRNGCLESIETLMAEGKIYDIEYLPWVPVSNKRRLPKEFQRVLVTVVNYNDDEVVRVAEYYSQKNMFRIKENNEEWKVGEKGLLAWMPLPKGYKAKVR